MKKLQISPLRNQVVRLARFSQGGGPERKIVSENPAKGPKNTANFAAGRGPCEGL